MRTQPCVLCCVLGRTGDRGRIVSRRRCGIGLARCAGVVGGGRMLRVLGALRVCQGLPRHTLKDKHKVTLIALVLRQGGISRDVTGLIPACME